MPPVQIKPVSGNLEIEDILEMASAGIIPITVADNHLANFWAGILKGLKVHSTLVLRSGGEIAWAIRKNSPQLKAAINRFVKKHRQGTLKGNILIKRYLEKK